MSDEHPPGFDDDTDTVAIRHPGTGAPVPIPRELAMTEARAFRAYSAYLGGMKWEMIADSEGYLDAKTAQADVKLYLEQARSLYNSFTAQQAKALQLARLETLLSATWPAALKGNLPAVNSAHGLVGSIIKLAKLDEITDDEGEDKPQTVIVGQVGESSEEYVAELQRAAED